MKELLARCPFSKCIKLHFKYIEPILTFTNPIARTINVPERTKIVSMRGVFATADIGVIIASRQAVYGTLLLDVDIGVGRVSPQKPCKGALTDDQNKLFDLRDDVPDGEIVIYFVRVTKPAFNGCALHPDGKPGAAIADAASAWTLAHETCHVLGLDHITGEDLVKPGDCKKQDTTRLMTGCSTSLLVGVPTLSTDEVQEMRSSSLTYDCRS
jgi:hypothetical protein